MKLQFALAAATLLRPTLAMNPEDVVGVLVDAVVPNPDLCQALCQKNKQCFYSKYHFECDQCWQMDCSGGMYRTSGTVDYTKLTMETIFYCDPATLPEMPTDCSNLTATATITALDQAAATGGSDEDKDEDKSAAGTRDVSWIALGAAVAAIAAAL